MTNNNQKKTQKCCGLQLAQAWIIFALFIAAGSVLTGCRENQDSIGKRFRDQSHSQASWRITQVRSSVFDRLGYDRVNQTARAWFENGQVYDYYNVPPHVYAAWLRASSKGKYFHQHIRGHYRYAKITAFE